MRSFLKSGKRKKRKEVIKHFLLKKITSIIIFADLFLFSTESTNVTFNINQGDFCCGKTVIN